MTTIALTTVCLNAERTIQRCLGSVAAQKVPADEYIVIDGQSTDGTLALAQKAVRQGLVSKFISEPDSGISDAFNKAWRATNSDYIANINADDVVLDKYLGHVRQAIDGENPDIIIFEVYFGNETLKQLIKPRFSRKMPPARWFHPAINHPGMVIRRALLEKIGGYDTNYKIAMDIDLFYRLLAFNPHIVVINKPLIHQWDGGVSQQKWRLALTEMRRIEIAHGRSSLSAWIAYFFRFGKKFIRTASGL